MKTEFAAHAGADFRGVVRPAATVVHGGGKIGETAVRKIVNRLIVALLEWRDIEQRRGAAGSADGGFMLQIDPVSWQQPQGESGMLLRHPCRHAGIGDEIEVRPRNAVHGERDVKITLILGFQELPCEIVHLAVVVQAIDVADGDFEAVRRWRPFPRCRQQGDVMAAADCFFCDAQRVLLQATAGKVFEKRQKKFHY